jgi:hypothetical protein
MNPCPNCGAAGCDAQFAALLARDFEQPALYWKSHRLLVDVYSIQHDAYIRSAKSFAAHLCGLCIALERHGDERSHRKLQSWLSSNPRIAKPPLPSARGRLTIQHVSAIADPDQYDAALREWASSVWEAFTDLQPLPRDWLAASMALPLSTP